MRIIPDRPQFPEQRFYEQSTSEEVDLIFRGLTGMVGNYRSQSCTVPMEQLKATIAEPHVLGGRIAVEATRHKGLTTARLTTEISRAEATIRRYTTDFLYRHPTDTEAASASYEMRVESVGRQVHHTKLNWVCELTSDPMPVRNDGALVLYNYVAALCSKPMYAIDDLTRSTTLFLELGFPPPDADS